jgi:hypothetical protein
MCRTLVAGCGDSPQLLAVLLMADAILGYIGHGVNRAEAILVKIFSGCWIYVVALVGSGAYTGVHDRRLSRSQPLLARG